MWRSGRHAMGRCHGRRADSLPPVTLAGYGIPVRRFSRLDTSDPRTPASEQAGQVPLAAAGIQHRPAGDITEQAEDVRIVQDAPPSIALRAEGPDSLLRHPGPR